jgi:hypothetical protein
MPVATPQSSRRATRWVAQASGGANNTVPLATWANGTDPCRGWRGVTCSGTLQPAVTRLVLGKTGAAGNITALAPLVGLTYLNLYNTVVGGDVAALAPLVGLTYLNLYNTAVGGDVAALAPLVGLTWLSLSDTAVGGDVAGLALLVGLTYLSLQSTGVTGCAAFCAPGGPFHTRCDPLSGGCTCTC